MSKTYWEGVPGSPEHRTAGLRAWCLDDHEWCYTDDMCDCCHATLGYEQVWFDPKVGPPERAILQDLINEASVAWGSDPDSVAAALDRAEARLREAYGGDS